MVKEELADMTGNNAAEQTPGSTGMITEQGVLYI